MIRERLKLDERAVRREGLKEPERRTPGNTVVVVAGRGSHQTQTAHAKHYYTSELFVLGRELALAGSYPWVVLHPTRGVLLPDDLIVPTADDDLTITDLPSKVRTAWAQAVSANLGRRYGEALAIFVAPYAYSTALSAPVEAAMGREPDMSIPLMDGDRCAELRRRIATVKEERQRRLAEPPKRKRERLIV